MKIELKRVQHAEFASEETNCFTANLYVEGKKIATCENSGHGGPTNVHYDRKHADIITRFKAHVDKMPPIETDYKDSKDPTKKFTYKVTDEGLVDDLLEKFLEVKWLKSLCRGKIALRFTDTPEGEWLSIKGRYTSERAAQVRARYGDKIEEILNERFIRN